MTTYRCETCGDTYTETTPATGHSYTAAVTAPTCTEKGYTTYTCTACGDHYTANEVAALGHDYAETTVPATCTENGSVTHTCTRCGNSYTETLPATGPYLHRFRQRGNLHRGRQDRPYLHRLRRHLYRNDACART